jgi:hypothetical protein
MLKLDAMKGMFFDRAAVMKAADAGTRKVLSKFGAFVRTSAKSSIRKRRRASEPGMPPSSHTGLLKKFIFFGYDASKKSVVIGPTLLNGKAGTAPEALEYGGTAVLMVRKQGMTRKGQREKKVIQIKKRPYMQPAFDKNLPQLPSLWANSIKK